MQMLRGSVLLGLGLLAVIIIEGQACSPVAFDKAVNANSTLGKPAGGPGTTGGGDDPSCSGFSASGPTDVVVPDGQSSVDVQFTGQLGKAVPPMKWIVPGQPAVTGQNVTLTFTPGLYTIQVMSGNNACVQNLGIKVNPNSCPMPGATQINFQILTPPDQLFAGDVLQFGISNLNSLKNVKVYWDATQAAFQNIVSTPFSHQYMMPGTYKIRVEAEEKQCGEKLTALFDIVIKEKTCTPSTTMISAQLLTNDPVAELPVNFQVNNFAQLENGTVYVDFKDGTTTSASANPIAHTYGAITNPTTYNVVFTAKDKTCKMPLSTTIAVNLKPKACTPTVTTIDAMANYTGTLLTTTPVTIYINNATSFSSLTYDLGNGAAGTIQNPQPASVPGPQYFPNAQTYNLMFTAKGPGTCNMNITKTISLTPQRPIIPSPNDVPAFVGWYVKKNSQKVTFNYRYVDIPGACSGQQPPDYIDPSVNCPTIDLPMSATTCQDPVFDGDRNGDPVEFCYEPSGARGMYNASGNMSRFNTLTSYILASNMAPQVVTKLDDLFLSANDHSSDNLCLREGLFYYALGYLSIPQNENPATTPSKYQFALDYVDDGLQIAANSYVMGHFKLVGANPTINLGTSLKSGANTLTAIWVDDCAIYRTIDNARFLINGAVKMPLAPNLVRGYFRDVMGTPYAGAAVRIQGTGATTGTYNVSTDANGFYEKPGIPDGDYVITAAPAPGHATSKAVHLDHHAADTAIINYNADF